MSVLNFDTRNAMDTRRTEHANAYMSRSNGLIKSASTSTCCANEEALLKNVHHKLLVSKNGDHQTIDGKEYPKLPSLTLSHAAAVARNASLFADENSAKKYLRNKFLFHNKLKHLSDCNLNKIGLATAPDKLQINGIFKTIEDKRKEGFSSHRALDNVLISRNSNGEGCSTINFTAVNDLKQDPRPRVNGMSSPSSSVIDAGANSGGKQIDKATDSKKHEVVINDTKCEESTETKENHSERRRKTSVFDCNREQMSSDHNVDQQEINNAGHNGHALSEVDETDKVLAEPENNDANFQKQTKNTATPPQTPEKEEKRYRRSSSLKMPKENDSNPAQKKIVRFADALGLDLADVRTFLDELPSVPKSAYSDLQSDELPLDRVQPHLTVPETKTLVPMFKQPHTSMNFLDRVRDNFVSLEFAKVSPSPICSISGTVRVRNLDFHKSVYVRYTMDGWRTFSELQAIYVPDSCDGFSDKFAFVIYVYDVKVNQRVELAVRYHCCGSIFWDNNNGSNYVFQCLPSAPIVPSYFQYFNPMNDFCNSFY